LQGVARVVTGKIVEQNPKGFAVSTPEGNIGIRGTIISVRTGNGSTTVYVENTVRAVYVNNINVPGGQKITSPSDPVRLEPIQPQDRRNLGRDLAFRGGTGVAAAAPEPTHAGDRPEEQLRGTTQLTANAGLVPPDSLLSDVSLPTQSLGDSLGATSLTASVSGSLSSTMGSNSFSGYFGFSVDLSSGGIYGATIDGSGNGVSGSYSGAFTVHYRGGTGMVVPPPMGPHYEIHNFSAGPGTTAAFATPAVLANSGLKGPGDLTAVPNGGSVSADYIFYDGSSTLDLGSGSGTLTK
jgi:hypothetical protein